MANIFCNSEKNSHFIAFYSTLKNISSTLQSCSLILWSPEIISPGSRYQYSGKTEQQQDKVDCKERHKRGDKHKGRGRAVQGQQ
jgi:hypothetical protein